MIFKNKNAGYKIKRSHCLYTEQHGFTLIEMMIAMAITLLVTAGVYEVFSSQQKAFRIQDHVAEMQQNARVALDFMTREIRMAGYIAEDWDLDSATSVPTTDVTGQSWTGTGAQDIEELGPGAITFEADVDGDDQTETVRYTISNGNLTRATWQWDGTSAWTVESAATALAENIETLAFTYSDSGGTVTATAANIRIIQIQLVAKTRIRDPNLKGGDGYRRRMLTANVRPRNLGL